MDWSLVFGWGALTVLLASGIQLAMPIALAAVGETFCERSGILNLGVEGTMLVGAFGSFLVVFKTGNVPLGVAAGVLSGVLLAAVMAFLSITLKTDQIINGIAIVIFAQGITAFLFEQIFGGSVQPTLEPLANIKIPLLGSIPGIGPVLFNHNWVLYLGGILVIAVWLVLNRTRIGLSVRAAGESAIAADAAGVNVDRVRWLALLVGGAMAGLGGTVLVVGDLSLFEANITGGRGWIAVALVIFGRWRTLWVFGGAMFFGVIDALQVRVRSVTGGTNAEFPYEIFQALPYVLTLVVLVVATVSAKRNAMPSDLGTPFRK